MPKTKVDNNVSPNNPCPFLRALVEKNLLSDDVNAISDVATTIVKVAKTGNGSPSLPSLAIRAIALIANGLGPLSVAQNAYRGVQLDALRNGPLDKKGSGSRILDSLGSVNEVELERLAGFASDKIATDGTMEPGLDASELKKMMDDNFARAKGRRRVIDRKLMDGEWPVLLKVIGKQGKHGRYLSVVEVRNLFIDRVLPKRMMDKLDAS